MPWTHEMVKEAGESRLACRFCGIKWLEPYEHDSPEQVKEKRDHLDQMAKTPCAAAERRQLIHDVGAEAASKGSSRPSYATQERDLSREYLTPWAHSVVIDGRFAKEMASFVIGEGHDGHAEIVAEIFREIRSERRRLELGEEMIRITHPIYVDPLDLKQ